MAAMISAFPEMVRAYPMLRFMGSKFRLLPWLHEVLSEIEFQTALDGFSGSGCVSYLMKAMGKQVTSNDFLNFSATVARATTENPGVTLTPDEFAALLVYDSRHRRFIERTFTGIFFTPEDLRFMDRVWWNVRKLDNSYKQAIAISAIVRSCAKRQPRGVFTVAGDPERYKDGRRDLRLSIEEHFREQVEVYNQAAFDNGKQNLAVHGDAFDMDASGFDLVYFDPPYVPRSDDNCYVKRYHFLEGLSCYWEGLEIMETSRVKKVRKYYTPFSYRSSAQQAFARLFKRFASSKIVLSYSSNGYPSLDVLVNTMKQYKPSVKVHEKEHRYHFGTHGAAKRNEVTEYLIVGT